MLFVFDHPCDFLNFFISRIRWPEDRGCDIVMQNCQIFFANLIEHDNVTNMHSLVPVIHVKLINIIKKNNGSNETFGTIVIIFKVLYKFLDIWSKPY